MANVFLSKTPRDIDTALLLEKANVLNIGKATAYTDGNKIFINTEDNLFKILPAYDDNMLKWLLWHEKMHIELRHHNRFFKYLSELDEREMEKEFYLSKEEVNIIMDILVHDSMAKMFPELIETAVNNLAQMRNRNSLKYTFTTHTLEEMLEEYRKHKKGDDPKEPPKGKGKGKGKGGTPSDGPIEDKSKDKSKEDHKSKGTDDTKGHGRGGGGEDDKDTKTKDTEPEIKDTPEPEPEHDKTDWSKLDELDNKEFITEEENDELSCAIRELKAKKIRLGQLTETLNGLVTSTRKRTYTRPSTVYCGSRVILKGSTPGKTKLHLCFDASGSMGSEMETFKEIISKSIPQAMNTPTTWFSGHGAKIAPNPKGRSKDYYESTFKEFMKVYANNGYEDDGDRTIELCWKAEQLGYSPIGVTDGGGRISWSKDKLKELKRTVLIGPNETWLEKAKELNPKIQTMYI